MKVSYFQRCYFGCKNHATALFQMEVCRKKLVSKERHLDYNFMRINECVAYEILNPFNLKISPVWCLNLGNIHAEFNR